jgi:glycosyltransferase involved in cell wall biosynthesis
MFASNPNMRFVTDSEVIAEQFTAKYAKPMTVLPIPHVFAMDDTGGIEKEIYTLFLPGPARIEKGIETIVAAMSYLHQHHPQILLRLKLVLQFFGEKERAILEQLKSILQTLPLQLEFLEKLSSEEYKARFMQADIILIPYLNSRGYKARTSGVLAEAIAASKPFITTKDSWMHAQAINYKTGLAVQDEDEKALAEGIMEIVNHFTRFKNQAMSAKQPWLEFHSKDNFYNVFKGLMEAG